MIRLAKTAPLLFLSVFLSLSVFAEAADAFAIPRAEFAKYYTAVTGKPVPEGAVRFAIDLAVSKSGKDAYRIVSERRVKDNAPYQGCNGREYPPSEASAEGGSMRGDCPQAAAVTITGANMRSVMYGVYDLLERRAGCRWFWDGDVVPKKGAIDLSGLDIYEESRFDYRGIRYFAHRGLMRFQAEHWGPEEWKREIDWCLKKRLNLFMLRIGQDDLFQKAFPEICAYPDARKALSSQGECFDNRSLFWPLEYRGALRKEIMDYAFARGMMAPEDFGTMTHWYSRTPQDFLDKMKPDFLPQSTGTYGEPTGLVWDIRKKKWMDAYWQLTDTAIREYGREDLLHTIGIAERKVTTNRAENLRLKVTWTEMLLNEAKARHPTATRLLAGWDLYCMKEAAEVRRFLSGIPEDVIIWDYEADAYIRTNFTEWDVIGKRPYTFGVFMTYEAGLDMRTDYDLLAARQRLVADDPMCKGYILWPESSHTDSLGLEWFAQNAWRADRPDVRATVESYCASRYPAEAKVMSDLWLSTLPISTNMQNRWRKNAFLTIMREFGEGHVRPAARADWPAPKPDSVFAALPKVFAALKSLDWNRDEMLRRDMMDIARVWADRLAVEAENRMVHAYLRWLRGEDSAKPEVLREGGVARARLSALAGLLALHPDFSICDTYEKLRQIHPITNPDFASVLVDNAANFYCASHQAELAVHCYLPAFDAYLKLLGDRLRADDRTPPERSCLEAVRKRAIRMSLDELRLKEPRTRESFNQALDAIAAAAETPVVRNPSPRADFPPVPQIMGRDFIPLYSIYDGPSWEELVEKLEGLPLFRESALVCYGQNRLGVNSSRRANRFRRDFAEPIPESERRKTPYRLKDFFKQSATLQDALEGEGLPGCPFFLHLREDRPAHCVEASYPLADVADYETWKGKRPNFLGFHTLGEYDNDSRIYSEAKIPDLALRKHIENAFPPLPPKSNPLARRKAWFAWAKTVLQREQALHFGEKRIWPLMCASPGLSQVWCSLGVPGFTYEATMQCATLLPIVSPFVRGAARQFKVPFNWYMANYNNAFSRDGSYGPGSHDMRGPKAWRNNPELGPRPFRGVSRSFLDRLAAWGWLGGATFFQNEGWQGFHIDDRDGTYKASFYAHDLDDLYRLSKKVDRGVAYAPVALLTPMLDMFAYNGAENCVDPWAQPAFYYTLVPIRSKDTEFRELKRRGIEMYFVNSPFGAIWDILCPDSGQPTADFAAALSPYRCAFLLSNGYEKGAVDRAALANYVKDGGTLFVSADQITDGIVPAELAGVGFSARSVPSGRVLRYADGRDAAPLAEDYTLMLPEPNPSAKPFLCDENGNVLAFCHDTGRGRVITVTAPRMLPSEWQNVGRDNYKAKLGGILSGAKQFSLIRFLLATVQSETLPIDVEGNIQWGINKTKDGWLVWLMNADGVEKFRGEQQRIDLSKTSNVHVRMKGNLAGMKVVDAKTGSDLPTADGQFQANVKPGEWRLFKLTDR